MTDLAQKLRPVNTPHAGNNAFEHEHEDEDEHDGGPSLPSVRGDGLSLSPITFHFSPRPLLRVARRSLALPAIAIRLAALIKLDFSAQ